jgi:hypothetical protein
MHPKIVYATGSSIIKKGWTVAKKFKKKNNIFNNNIYYCICKILIFLKIAHAVYITYIKKRRKTIHEL